VRTKRLPAGRYARIAGTQRQWMLAYGSTALIAAVLLNASDHTLDSRQSRHALGLDQADGWATSCSPTDNEGLATISLEGLRNTTDGPITVTDIATTNPDELTVVDWWLARDDEDAPGAMSGAWPHPIQPWHTTLAPGDHPSIVVTVKAAEPSHATSETPVDVAFTTDDGDSGLATTNGRLLTGPPAGCPTTGE